MRANGPLLQVNIKKMYIKALAVVWSCSTFWPKNGTGSPQVENFIRCDEKSIFYEFLYEIFFKHCAKREIFKSIQAQKISSTREVFKGVRYE